MPIKLTTARDGSTKVWLAVDVYGRHALDAERGVLIGQGLPAGTALASAVDNLAQAVKALDVLQRHSAIEGYKRRDPV